MDQDGEVIRGCSSSMVCHVMQVRGIQIQVIRYQRMWVSDYNLNVYWWYLVVIYYIQGMQSSYEYVISMVLMFGTLP